MSGNLEDFLRQAAQRRQQRAAGQKSPPPSSRPPVRQAERSRQIVDAEVLDPEDSGESVSRRVIAPSPVSQPHVVPTLGPKVAPSKEIDTADERMTRHVQDWMSHPVSNLENQTLNAKDAIAAEIIPTPAVSEIQSSTNTQLRSEFRHPLVAMLRKSETIKAAFIASEIFKTKF